MSHPWPKGRHTLALRPITHEPGGVLRGGPPSWGSWASTASTCSSSCSWHSAAWANPGQAAWPLSQTTMQQGDDIQGLWSLPLDALSTAPLAPPSPSTASYSSALVRAARMRRSSVVAALLQEHRCTGPQHRHTPLPVGKEGVVDASAFYRYYEDGSVLGPGSGSRTVPGAGIGGGSSNSSNNNVGDSDVCGGAGLSSLALAVPVKLEGLLKLFAQSLHLVLAAMCTRKARRKERECTPAQEHEHKLYLEEAVLERKIPETDLRQLVELPPGLGYEEWLASHTIDFFQHINLLYGTVCEYCTLSGCPDMTGPATRQYLWFDEKGKKTRVAAPQYVDYVMTFTQKTINDETIFPTKFENEFPTSFESIVKKIHRLLFHVLAHLYHSHFREMVLLNLHAHLNCIFAHFILFNQRFTLIEEKETEILHDLVVALKLLPESEDSTTSAIDNSSTSLLTSTNTETNTSTTLTTSSCSQQLGEDTINASPITSDTSTVACPSQLSSSHCDSDSLTQGQESLAACTAESGIGVSLGPEIPSSGAMDTCVVAPPDTRP
ncbi:unnamed protein product, partial [Meganyctiphanes norvegica]